jgi:dolichol-phosphate mannosyltransferase
MQSVMLSVVVPTRHEAATICGFVDQLSHALSGIPMEVIFVDDSDLDDTAGVLLRKRAEVGDWLVVLHRPRGSVPERTLGTAVVAGIGLARGELVCVMDADGQHPPEAIPTLVAEAKRTGADYVGASRYLPGASADGLGGTDRKIISRGLGLVARCAFFMTPVRGMTDPLNGFFLFRRRLVEGVVLRPIGWKISLEIMIRSRAKKLAEVPYAHARRADDTSKATLQQGLLVLRHILVLLGSMVGMPQFGGARRRRC